MNISISPSNNYLLAKAKILISTQLGQKKDKNKNTKKNIFVLLPNIAQLGTVLS